MADFFSSCNWCPSVKNIIVLDCEGKRVAVKYYTDEWPTNSAKCAFEKSLFTKTLKSNARVDVEITMFSNNIGFFDAVIPLLRNTVDKREAFQNLDLIFLCLDEIVDQGMILETDASVIAGKGAIQNMDAGTPLSELTISQALATAREHLARTVILVCHLPPYKIMQQSSF
ncbi:hypothetical protein SLA2020_290360 [Shorea laevis]